MSAGSWAVPWETGLVSVEQPFTPAVADEPRPLQAPRSEAAGAATGERSLERGGNEQIAPTTGVLQVAAR
jgi:hypothetical protein